MADEEDPWKTDEKFVGVSMVMMVAGAIMYVISTAFSDMREEDDG